MDGAETPKKAVKESVNRANDCRRMCNCSFNVKYGTGKSGCMSIQNLYIASNRDGSRGEVLASMSKNILVLYSLNPRVCPSAFNTSKQTCSR